MRGWTGPLAGIAVLAMSAAAHGQGTIGDGSVSFTWLNWNSPASGTSFMVPGGDPGIDHSFQTEWFMRQAGDAGETRFGPPFSQSYVGDTATHGYVFADFLASVESVISEEGLNDGELTQTMTITNLTPDPLTLSVFHYQDLDLHGTASQDSATGGLGSITITDGSAVDEAEYSGTGPTAFQVLPYGTDPSGDSLLLLELNDEAVTNLDNSGLPFNGDFTASLQWDLVVPGNGQLAVSVTIGVVGNQSVCQAGAGDCFSANGTPGCENPSCCESVCDSDPACCDIVWDANCATLAGSICADNCSEDTNNDSEVDVGDLINVIIDWGCVGGSCIGDVNADLVVGVQDLVDVILAWGSCP